MKPFYITTAIHYVNELPHIGQIYENVVADVIARHRRAAGDDVFFLTGTDEHGQKIERSASAKGIPPIDLANQVVAEYERLWKLLGISHNDFIRTTEPRHKAGVHELIRKIRERNPDDIYLGEHTGWYCSSEEAFFPDSQVSDGRCENGHPVERTTEKNYFFRLSRYAQPLLDFYRSHPDFIKPQTRYNEVIAFVEAGLRDLSISRTSFSWGIPFPGDPEHIIYVWTDALTNYISALGFGSPDDSAFRKYWPGTHLIGKDIVRFHAVYWPAHLMAAGLDLPRQILGHGWWLRDDQKISKSTGNIVRPNEILDAFGPDPFRYYMLREMVFGQDANYSDEAFLQRYNSDLANDLGNTLSRSLKMCDTYFSGRTPAITCDSSELRAATEALVPDYLREMDQYAFQRALDVVWKLLGAINGYIVSREPWKHFKEHGADEALSRVIWNILEAQRFVWIMMFPFMPSLGTEALRRIGARSGSFDHGDLLWGGLPAGAPIDAAQALFPRVDAAEFMKTPERTTEGEILNPQDPRDGVVNPPVDAGPPQETTQAVTPDSHQITIDQFFEADLRVAEVLSAEKVEKSKKLMKIRVTTGDAERTVVAGIASKYSPEELVGRKVVIVANLKPATLMGIESNGMVLAASIDGEPSLVAVDPSVPPGTKVK